MVERPDLDSRLEQLLSEKERASLQTFIARLPDIPSVRELLFEKFPIGTFRICAFVDNPWPEGDSNKLLDSWNDLLSDYHWAFPARITQRDPYKNTHPDIELIKIWERQIEPAPAA